MKTVGIIAEYNPLHNGHRYQMQKARELADADFVVIAMSGNFVQRGEPAVYDKYARTRMALDSGADLVLEIPACFAVGSAEDFAACAVSLFSHLGVVDNLCFGSECGDILALMNIAKVLAHETDDFKKILKCALANGKTFPEAQAEALAAVLSQDLTALLASPNNILGIEYCKALLRLNSSIQPITITRHGAGYHDTAIHADGSAFASASAIRKALSETDISAIQQQIPWDFSNTHTPVFADDLSELFNYRLLDLYHSGTELTAFSDVSKELADRLSRQLWDFDSFTGRIQALKTRQYTYTRISRALLHILLGIRTDDMQMFRSRGYAEYARVLGFRKRAVPLLSKIKENGTLPLISKVSNAKTILEGNPSAPLAFQYDLHAAHIYQMIQYKKSGTRSKNEFTQPITILDKI